MTLKPQKKLLIIWRLLLTIVAFVPAFLFSLFLPLFSLPWFLLQGLWIIIFLFFFLYHLPSYLNNYAVIVTKQTVTVFSGVFYSTRSEIPCQHIQYVTQGAGPLSQLFGLATVRIILAGGRMTIPGLLPEQAEALTAFMKTQGKQEK